MCGWAGGLWKQSSITLPCALPSLRLQPFTLCNTEQTLHLVFQIECLKYNDKNDNNDDVNNDVSIHVHKIL